MKRLLKRAAGTLGLRVSYTLLTFVTSVVLARLLGKEGLGTYGVVTSWVYLLAIPATLGFDGLLGREVSIYQTKLSWDYMSGLLQWANVLTFFSSVAIATVGTAIVILSGDRVSPQIALCYFLIFASLPLLSLRNVRRGTMRGLHQIVIGLVPEMLVAPVVLLLLVGACALWLQDEFTVTWAIGAYLLVTCLTLFISENQLDQALPLSAQRAAPSYHRFDWVKQAWPFMFLESLNVINGRADTLMLGLLDGFDAAGVYLPVNRGAQLIVFILMAFNGPLSPTIASLYAEGKREELQRILIRTARVCLLASSVATTALLIFGRQYLTVFGPEFAEGIGALRILCIGQVLYVLVGLSPMVLSMTGYAQFTAITGLISAIINVSLNWLLIPRYGVNGAAIATASALLVSGIVNTFWVYIKVGVHPNILGRGH